jgi:putative intracellular protease/amidase
MRHFLIASVLALCLATSQAALAHPGKHALIVLTSHDKFFGTGRKTGFWFEEMSTPYYIFEDADIQVTLASVRGGTPPVDPKSDDDKIGSVKRFKADELAMARLADTKPLDKVDPEDYDGILIAGGHGAMWDLTDNAALTALLEAFIKEKKTVGALCHGPTALLALKNDKGKAFVRKRRVTAFTRAEEKAVGVENAVPNFLDTQLEAVGAEFVKAEPFKANAVADGMLVTGQNPASSEGVARLMLELLKKQKTTSANQH